MVVSATDGLRGARGTTSHTKNRNRVTGEPDETCDVGKSEPKQSAELAERCGVRLEYVPWLAQSVKELKAAKSHLLGRVAALQLASVTLGTLASFERTGRGCGDCNEGSDREKSREADKHLFKSSELNCWRGDGRCFADDELTRALPFYTTRTTFPFSLYPPTHNPFPRHAE